MDEHDIWSRALAPLREVAMLCGCVVRYCAIGYSPWPRCERHAYFQAPVPRHEIVMALPYGPSKYGLIRPAAPRAEGTEEAGRW